MCFPANSRVCVLAASVFASLLFLSSPQIPSVRAQSREPRTLEELDRWMKEVSNWGRWGAADQKGAVNLITPEKRKKAADLVRTGVSVSLSRDASTEKRIDNPNPFGHEMTNDGVHNPGPFAMDRISVFFHGWAHSHMDSLCHMFYKGKMYNGFPREEVTAQGAGKLDIAQFKEGIFTRGVLIDIPRLKGVPYLQPGAPIYPEDLSAWEKKVNTKVQPGDIGLVRTGRWAMQDEKGPWAIGDLSAGLHASTGRWFKERDIAVLGSDCSGDLAPSGIERITHPVHALVLVAMGAPMLDSLDLEAVAKEAARQNRWEFLVTAAPIPMPGGTGSPLNATATF